MLFLRWLPDRPAASTIAAGLLSSIIFAPGAPTASPLRVSTAATPTSLLWPPTKAEHQVWGCVYCWLYTATTRNLWFVIGVHSLANDRTMLIAAPDFAEYLPLSQMLGVAYGDRLGSTAGPQRVCLWFRAQEKRSHDLITILSRVVHDPSPRQRLLARRLQQASVLFSSLRLARSRGFNRNRLEPRRGVWLKPR